MTKKEVLDRCVKEPEERILLARVMDKLEMAQQRGIPSHTVMLSQAQQASVAELLRFCGYPRHIFFGGYEDAERRLCFFLPDWQEDILFDEVQTEEESPLCAIEAKFSSGSTVSHRDLLGSLMGLGLNRETLGDILQPEPNRCQVIALKEVAPILCSQWERVGRIKCKQVTKIPLSTLCPKPAQVKVIRNTVATPRLDAVVASAFSLSRAKASTYIIGGKVAINHRECQKADKLVEVEDVITCRGFGKCVVKELPGQSRKGRTMIVLERYL